MVTQYNHDQNFILLLFNYVHSGGLQWQGSDPVYSNNILEYNQKDEQWTWIGSMKLARMWHGVSIVDFAGFEKHCEINAATTSTTDLNSSGSTTRYGIIIIDWLV